MPLSSSATLRSSWRSCWPGGPMEPWTAPVSTSLLSPTTPTSGRNQDQLDKHRTTTATKINYPVRVQTHAVQRGDGRAIKIKLPSTDVPPKVRALAVDVKVAGADYDKARERWERAQQDRRNFDASRPHRFSHGKLSP